MELLQIKDLSFTYPKHSKPALDHISLSVIKGSFNLIFGASGCGKTTLLKLIKRELAPFGEKNGQIFYDGQPIGSLDDRKSAAEIGFVCQNPDDGIVTDKVWHELAFGMENLGIDTNTIRRRVGELASYFGIGDWYHKNTDQLSGGQKQLLNLASVMTMKPKLLLLDEPTSQLDPIAASDFIGTLQKLNRDLGLTIILVEHRLEEVFPMSSQVVALENGEVCFCGTPGNVCRQLHNHNLAAGLPSSARIWNGLGGKGECPLTVKEGREYLENCFGKEPAKALHIETRKEMPPVIEAQDLWFRYEKDTEDVLRGFNLTVQKGEIFSILGGNGSGKTTALNIIGGLDRPYKGKIKINSKKIGDYKNNSLYQHNIALLPQNPQTVFFKNTVIEDCKEILEVMNIPKEQRETLILQTAEQFGVDMLLDKHPYDISGGEMQKCAFLKLLLSQPEILLLDEPTKGLDAISKNNLSDFIFSLQNAGKTILLVTHDVEFAAIVSDRCALFFDGELISQGTPNEFFSDNNFYTTAASRISRDICENAVLCQEVISLCKKEV